MKSAEEWEQDVFNVDTKPEMIELFEQVQADCIRSCAEKIYELGNTKKADVEAIVLSLLPASQKEK